MTSLPADHLLQDLTSCERQVWDALVQGDAVADAALLCESFLGVYGTGFAGKADHTGQLEHGPTVQTYELSQLTARALGPEYAVLSYHARFQRWRSPHRRRHVRQLNLAAHRQRLGEYLQPRYGCGDIETVTSA
ncbi:nuclear transport factor 2 family protein [Tritonibacter mobilis]|uniref:nuclear transport factor 2 family protein n=1 Tax=Tritonibacter mobilis TaxID=379347 RepID=UPI0008959AE2|nr:nuclear transport factor 2 family protein [Tritonibacter mobilis]GLP87597.1 hypothetical protein GCM10007921_31570 [Tritonibacter mobilis]SDX58033.1 protein of unknown function [Tritonibacter mobilis]